METAITVPIDTLLTLTWYFTLIIYIVFCLIFHYHWQAYSLSAKVTLQTYIAFFATSIPLLLMAASAVYLL